MHRGNRSYSFFLEKNYRWTVSISLGLFFYLFMAAFLPFGVSNYDPDHQYTFEFMLMLSWFMLANIAVASLLEVVLKPFVLHRTTWLQVISWSLLVILLLGTTSYLIYNIMGNFHDWSFSSGIAFVFDCGKVLVFPQLGVFFFFLFKDLQNQYRSVRSLSEKPNSNQLIALKGHGTNEEINLKLNDLCCLQAQDNYVAVHHLQLDQMQKTLIRSSLTQLIEQVGSKQLVRCHRSYAVNPYRITAVKGRIPVQLQVSGIEQTIPVSKTYKQSVALQLQSLGILKK